MVKKKRDSQDVTAVTQPITVEETTSMDNLRANLEEIKTYDGVVGYILRNSTSAAIDLKDPTKIIDYAILSSSLRTLLLKATMLKCFPWLLAKTK